MLSGSIDPRRPDKQVRYKAPAASNNAAPGEDLTPDYMNILDSQRKSMHSSTSPSRRFKVVKIESTKPFKRGRWECMDFLDQSYDRIVQHNNRVIRHNGALLYPEDSMLQVFYKEIAKYEETIRSFSNVQYLPKLLNHDVILNYGDGPQVFCDQVCTNCSQNNSSNVCHNRFGFDVQNFQNMTSDSSQFVVQNVDVQAMSGHPNLMNNSLKSYQDQTSIHANQNANGAQTDINNQSYENNITYQEQVVNKYHVSTNNTNMNANRPDCNNSINYKPYESEMILQQPHICVQNGCQQPIYHHNMNNQTKFIPNNDLSINQSVLSSHTQFLADSRNQNNILKPNDLPPIANNCIQSPNQEQHFLNHTQSILQISESQINDHISTHPQTQNMFRNEQTVINNVQVPNKVNNTVYYNNNNNNTNNNNNNNTNNNNTNNNNNDDHIHCGYIPQQKPMQRATQPPNLNQCSGLVPKPSPSHRHGLSMQTFSNVTTNTPFLAEPQFYLSPLVPNSYVIPFMPNQVSIPLCLQSQSSQIIPQNVLMSNASENSLNRRYVVMPEQSNLVASTSGQIYAKSADISSCVHSFLQDGMTNCDNVDKTNCPISIDAKIEALMDLVKKHLKFAVLEDVNILKQKILVLKERVAQLEYENELLKRCDNQKKHDDKV